MSSSETLLYPNLMELLASRIAAATGLSFPPAKWRDLQVGIARISEDLGLANEIDCINWLIAEPWNNDKQTQCARFLTIAETYFFREPRAFDLVCEYVREKQHEKHAQTNNDAGNPLRIWSAGCCTGEEPYSIAMTLASAFPAMQQPQVSILATDLNGDSLEHARAARYRHWSFRGVGMPMQRRYFNEESDGRFRLKKTIREKVRFSQLNLADTAYPSVTTGTNAIDIIFCRNVLMYFSREQATEVIARFRDCLIPGGWLVVSASEASSEMFAGFTGRYFPDAIFYRKNGGAMPPAQASEVVHMAPLVERRIMGRAELPLPPPVQKALSTPSTPLASSAPSATPLQSALALADAGHTAPAMAKLEHALTQEADNVELHRAKAMVALQAGDRDAALHSLRRVLYLEPDFILGHYLMGMLQATGQRHQRALRQFETAEKLLAELAEDELVPGTDGLTAGYLMQSLRSMMQKERA